MLEERFGDVPCEWLTKDVIEVAMRELAHMDQWADGLPEGALKWLNAPGWKELGFASQDDYAVSMISTDPPSVAMPPPVPGKR